MAVVKATVEFNCASGPVHAEAAGDRWIVRHQTAEGVTLITHMLNRFANPGKLDVDKAARLVAQAMGGSCTIVEDFGGQLEPMLKRPQTT